MSEEVEPPGQLTQDLRQIRNETSRSLAPACYVCNENNGRKASIQCIKCSRHAHAISCLRFPSLKVAHRLPHTCNTCSLPSSLPVCRTPSVAARELVFETSDDTIPASDAAHDVSDDVSPPPSPSISVPPPRPPPLAASSPIGHDHGLLAARALPQPPAAPPPSQIPPSLPFSFEDLFSTRIPVLPHCPKSACGQFKELLRVVFTDVTQNPLDVSKWARALSVAKLTLFIPPGKKTFKEKAAVVKQRISAFLQGRYEDLWHQATSSGKGRKPSPNSKPQEMLNVRRATRLAQEGQFGQAAKTLVSDGLDFDSAESVDAMRSKHPYSPLPLPPSQTPYSFTPTKVLAALNSFSSTTAAGPSGLRAAHFKDALSAKDMTAGITLINVMCSVINILSKGGAPDEIAPYLCGANLFAANKKDGGHRPIAVGETIRRWTAKCLVKKGIEDAADHLAPYQLGVGVKSGCESIIHAASSIYSNEETPVSDKWVLQIDMNNAFNNISREVMLAEVAKICPKLYPFAKYCYENASYLYFGSNRILSTTGAQQGDPLAILFYALVAQPLIKRIKEESPGLLLNAWILDDGALVGKKDELVHSFDLLTKFGPAYGLFLNAKKSLVWAGDDESLPDIHDPLGRGVPRAAAGGFCLLGAPVGDIPFSNEVVKDRVGKIAAIFDHLPSLNDSHVAFCLLRYCFSLPKFSYCLRTCEPSSLLPTYRLFDNLVLSTFSVLIGHPLDEPSRAQIALPIKFGGMGLRSAENHCAAAFIASVHHSQRSLDSLLPPSFPTRPLTAAFPLLQTHTGNPTYSSLDLLPPEFTQHSLSSMIDKHNHTALFSSADIRNKARLNSLSRPCRGLGGCNSISLPQSPLQSENVWQSSFIPPRP